MHIHQEESWEARAKAKVAETQSKIPKKWRLNQSSLDKAKQMKKLSGAFIESLLSDEELSIIRNDSTLLVEKVKIGEYTALQVAQAFCKTAAVAHQIVSNKILLCWSLYSVSAFWLLFTFLECSCLPSLTLPDIEQLPSRNPFRTGAAESKGVRRLLQITWLDHRPTSWVTG